MDFSWHFISTLVAATALLVGLVKFYFGSLSKRLDSHITSEEKFQTELLKTLTSMSSTLIKRETRAESYITVGVHLDALRKIDESITASRHSTIQTVQTLITHAENNFLIQLQALEKRVTHLEGD